MEILGWVIWLVACGWGVVSLLAFLCEVFLPNPYPEGPEVLYPFFLRRLITGFAALGFIGAVVVTALTELSKLNLLWFVPVWHLVGVQRWIEWIYLSFKPDMIDLVYPDESDMPKPVRVLSPSLIPRILRRKYQVLKEEASTKGWEHFPGKFVQGLKAILGEGKFDCLTLLAEKYRLFDQDFFAHPETFTDIGNEITALEIACLLTSMGNDLCGRQILDDAEKAYRITLALRPEHFAARAMLAAICYDSDRLSEARTYAREAITDMNSHAERYKDIPVPEHIAHPNAINSFWSLLQLIAEGETSD